MRPFLVFLMFLAVLDSSRSTHSYVDSLLSTVLKKLELFHHHLHPEFSRGSEVKKYTSLPHPIIVNFITPRHPHAYEGHRKFPNHGLQDHKHKGKPHSECFFRPDHSMGPSKPVENHMLNIGKVGKVADGGTFVPLTENEVPGHFGIDPRILGQSDSKGLGRLRVKRGSANGMEKFVESLKGQTTKRSNKLEVEEHLSKPSIVEKKPLRDTFKSLRSSASASEQMWKDQARGKRDFPLLHPGTLTDFDDYHEVDEYREESEYYEYYGDEPGDPDYSPSFLELVSLADHFKAKRNFKKGNH